MFVKKPLRFLTVGVSWFFVPTLYSLSFNPRNLCISCTWGLFDLAKSSDEARPRDAVFSSRYLFEVNEFVPWTILMSKQIVFDVFPEKL